MPTSPLTPAGTPKTEPGAMNLAARAKLIDWNPRSGDYGMVGPLAKRMRAMAIKASKPVRTYSERQEDLAKPITKEELAMNKTQSDSNAVALMGYMNKEAGWKEVIQKIIASLQSGKGFQGIPLEYLTGGGSALLGGGLGAMLAQPGNRMMGGLGGALLGGGLGYLGGRHGAKPLGDWLAKQKALQPGAPIDVPTDTTGDYARSLALNAPSAAQPVKVPENPNFRNPFNTLPGAAGPTQ